MSKLDKDVVAFSQLVDNSLPAFFCDEGPRAAAVLCVILNSHLVFFEKLLQRFAPASFGTLLGKFLRHGRIAGEVYSDRLLAFDVCRNQEKQKQNSCVSHQT